MISNEQELRTAYESITRLYRLRDQIAQDKSAHPGTRLDEVDGVDAMIHKIERQVAEYLASREASSTAA